MVPVPSRNKAPKKAATRFEEGGEGFGSFSISSPKKLFGFLFGKVIDGKVSEVLVRPSCTAQRSQDRERRNAGLKKRFFSSVIF
jgi:hypothetical protein